MTDPTVTAEKLVPYAQGLGKPVLASWMGGADVEKGDMVLNQAHIPTFAYPDSAARMFDYMAHYSTFLRLLYETPMLPDGDSEPKRDYAAEIIQHVRQTGRTILTEYESKQLLSAYGIPTVETRIAKSADEAAKIADEIGYPIVVKLHSETITHKTDVGGVKLNLRDAAAVRAAYESISKAVSEKAGDEHFLGVTVQPMLPLDGYELILGSSIDPQFGPVLLFGMGGTLVEVFKDRALGLPPLNTTLARRMMERTTIYKALKGVRGRKSVDLVALEQMLVRFSQLISEQHWIKELDINPLLASEERLLALDARVVIHDPGVTEDKLPQLAIRPYPSQYVSQWTAKDGSPLTIRPIRAEDEPMLVKFHETLSDRTVYMRYLHPMLLSERVAHDRLARICHSDYNREISLIAEQIIDPETATAAILGIGRLSKIHGSNEARFTLLVNDQYQGKGIGTELIRRLIDVGRSEKLDRIEALIAPENQAMQNLCQKLGFQLKPLADKNMIAAEMKY
jgi:acetyltransferase